MLGRPSPKNAGAALMPQGGKRQQPEFSGWHRGERLPSSPNRFFSGRSSVAMTMARLWLIILCIASKKQQF
jgi:hypothetical protein